MKNKFLIINIAGVLIALLNLYLIFSPSLKNISAPAEIVQVKENLRVIGIAMESYYNDNQKYPESDKVKNLKDLLEFLSPYLERISLPSFTILNYSADDHNFSLITKINESELELTPQGIIEK